MARVGFSLIKMRSPVVRPLIGVAVVMCYLASLAFASALGVGRWVNQWQNQASLKMSLYIPVPEDDIENRQQQKKIQQLLRWLRQHPDIHEARLVSKQEMAALLKPWIKKEINLAELPLLQLIDITRKPNPAFDEDKMRQYIHARLPHSDFENHYQWNAAIGRWVLFIQIIAGIILLTAFGCMAAVIGLAAYAAIDANHDLVSILHIIGAEDSFIVHTFRRYFLKIGFVAGTIGAAGAALTFFSGERLSQWIPDSLNIIAFGFVLQPIDYAALTFIPFLSCLIAVVASRRQTMQHLRHLP